MQGSRLPGITCENDLSIGNGLIQLNLTTCSRSSVRFADFTAIRRWLDSSRESPCQPARPFPEWGALLQHQKAAPEAFSRLLSGRNV